MKFDLTEEMRTAVIYQAAQLVAARVLEGQDIRERIRGVVDKALKAHCDEAVTPVIEKGIREFEFRVTNRFGESEGGTQTLTEYLVGRAEAYLEEEVSWHDGSKPPKYTSAGSKCPRLVYLIDGHLTKKVERAMQEAAADIVAKVGPALARVAETQIKAAAEKLKPRKGR